MTEDQLLQAIQSRAARISVGASTVRGRGNAGVVAASRSHLRRVDLSRFGQTTRARFNKNLDSATIALRDSLPRGARHWGLARKVLNIFLRDCLYTIGSTRKPPAMRQPVGAFPAFTWMPSGGRQAGTTMRSNDWLRQRQADAAISDIVRYPHLLILGCIMDRAVLDAY